MWFRLDLCRSLLGLLGCALSLVLKCFFSVGNSSLNVESGEIYLDLQRFVQVTIFFFLGFLPPTKWCLTYKYWAVMYLASSYII